MNEGSINRYPLKFFLMVYALSIPLRIIGTMVEVKGLPDDLPITDAAATFVPLIAAVILVYRKEKWGGVKRLLMRAFDYRKIRKKVWYIPILLLMPFLYILTYFVMRAIGLPLLIEWNIPPQVPLVFMAFFIAAVGEELLERDARDRQVNGVVRQAVAHAGDAVFVVDFSAHSSGPPSYGVQIRFRVPTRHRPSGA